MKSTAFPKILHLGDSYIETIFDEEVEITEKLDGSQFGFGIVDGQLIVRSKGKEQDLDSPDKMFVEGVEYIKSIEHLLQEGIFYYGEYLQKPRHSTLAYDKIPKNNIALFAIFGASTGRYFEYETIVSEAERLEIDAIPLIYKGKSNPEHALSLVDGTSYLGGSDREGIVVKNYKDWEYLGRLHYTVMSGKFVTEKFKEVHTADWKKLNTGKGKLDAIMDQYLSEARWQKAINHLRERGELDGSPRDIGPLIKEIQADVIEEEKEHIKAQLWSLFGDDFTRRAISGFPQWYKEELAKGNVNL